MTANKKYQYVPCVSERGTRNSGGLEQARKAADSCFKLDGSHWHHALAQHWFKYPSYLLRLSISVVVSNTQNFMCIYFIHVWQYCQPPDVAAGCLHIQQRSHNHVCLPIHCIAEMLCSFQSHNYSECIRPNLPPYNVSNQTATFQLKGSLVIFKTCTFTLAL